MADNVPITAGVGTPVATDEIAGAHYQRVKISDGTADSANHAVVDLTGALRVASPPNETVTGTIGALNEIVAMSVSDTTNSVTIVYTASASSDMGIEAQVTTDNVTWVRISGSPADGLDPDSFVVYHPSFQTFSAQGQTRLHSVNVTGYSSFRLKCTEYYAGSVDIVLRSVSGTHTVPVAAVAGYGIAYQGFLRVNATTNTPDGSEVGLVTRNIPSGLQEVSVLSSALPSGASTAAKQPALGTAGTSSADVLTVQGRAAMTPLLVDGSAVTHPVSAASLPLPTGASTAANQATIIGHVDGIEGLLTTIDADTGALAGAVAGTEIQVDVVAALPTGANTIGAVNLAQYTPASGRLPVDGSGVTQPVSGTFFQATQPVSIAATVAVSGPLTDAELRAAAVPVSAASLPLPSGASTAAKQPALGTAGSAASDVITVQGIASMTALKVDGSAVTQPVSIAATVAVKEIRAATGTLSNVAGSASSVTLLASNANRLGAAVYNDSTAILYLKLGATASSTSFTVKMNADDYYEIPANYTGIIDGIWASAAGSARVTEIT